MQPHLRLRTFLTGITSAFLIALTGCGPGEVVDSGCENGETRSCYSGPEDTAGIGQCRRGEQTCRDGQWSACEGEVTPGEEVCDGIDNNCDGEVDEHLRNACGGCAELEGLPETPCGTCGVWECTSPEAVFCIPPSPAIGATCVADNGCEGVMECRGDNVARCVTVQRPNECGVCNGPRVDGLGEPCEVDGCAGEFICDGTGEGVVCSATGRNNCGTCNAPDVEGVGESCLGADNCEGVAVCDSTGTGVLCDAPGRNECGACGAPPVTGLDEPCTVGDCVGTTVCNDTLDDSVCSSTGLNNCFQCNEPDVPGIDETCVADNGCEGVGVCDGSSPDRMHCVALSSPNSCGLCGGPPIADLGSSCVNTEEPDGCEGVMVCTEDGTDTVCNAPLRNACGGCGELVADEGDPCLTDEECEGTWTCTEGGDLECVSEFSRNACGVCGDPVPDIGGTCHVDIECSGRWECTEDGLDRHCVAIDEPNECGICGGAPVPSANQGCFTADFCPSVLECDGSGEDVRCREVDPATCPRTDHVVFSEFAPGGPNPLCPDPEEPCTQPNAWTQNEFIEIYNPTPNEIDLSGYMIWRRTNIGTVREVQRFHLVFEFPEHSGATPTRIGSRRYMLWGGYHFKGPANFKSVSSVDHLPTSLYGGQLWLIRAPEPDDPNPIGLGNPPPDDLHPSDPRVVDMVGWGTSEAPANDEPHFWHEGTGPAPALYGQTQVSLERKAFAQSTADSMSPGGHDERLGNGYDSNDSAADWVLRPVRQPQNRSSNPEPPLPSHP